MGNLISGLTNWSNPQVSPPQQDTTNGFGKLSPEIRLKIWRLVFERDQLTLVAWPRAATPPMAQVWDTHWANYRQLGTNPPRSITLPMTLHINEESRQETLRGYEPVLAFDPPSIISRVLRQIRGFMPAFRIAPEAPPPRVLTKPRYFIPGQDTLLLKDGVNDQTVQAARLHYLSQIPGS
jgi:hypothetical protein